MVLPRVSPQPYTHLAFEGFQFAKEHGKPREYNHEVFKAFFQDQQDIGNVDVLAGVAGKLGLNEREFRDALESRRYRELHLQALADALEHHIQAVPTILIGKDVIAGLASREKLEELIRKNSKD